MTYFDSMILGSFLQKYVPLNDIDILNKMTLVCLSPQLNSSYGISCRDFKLATQFRPELGVCMKEMEFRSWSFLQKFIPLNDIHAYHLPLL